MDQIKITKYFDVMDGLLFDSFNLKYANNIGGVNMIGNGLLSPS